LTGVCGVCQVLAQFLLLALNVIAHQGVNSHCTAVVQKCVNM